ncbi:MAG: hypothetical protein AMS27_14055 [Bacteroides sp. SM23_62_1]|nr:MAG: hypothetical protein AMS27_14055 [Bacteroides sp. SM23_62_1]
MGVKNKGFKYTDHPCNKKYRDNHVCQSHTIFIGSFMLQPAGIIRKCLKVIRRNHQEHGKSPEDICRLNSTVAYFSLL